MGEAPEDDKVIVADKQWHAQEQVDDIVIMVAVDVHQQEALLMSYRATREIHHEQMRHRILRAEKEGAYEEIDEVAAQVYDDTDDTASYMSVAPCRHDDEAGMSMGTTGSEDE